MSSDGRTPRLDLPLGLVIDLRAGEGFDVHTHDQHQIALASSGVLVMGVAHTSWVLPRNRALWIPAGVPHTATASGLTTMLSTYLDPELCPLSWTEPTVVEASALLGALVSHLSSPGLASEERQRAEAVLWDVMIPLPTTTLSPALPVDERARKVAERLLEDVTDHRTLAAWGRDVGASARTLARLFLSETGMGFERWRSTARLAAALPLLAQGGSVSSTAYRVGYGSPSAFVAAFRREVGTTPADYFRSAHP
jgi:AraC-like DNA-binding protein